MSTFGPSITKNNHPPWFPPISQPHDVLMVQNSLTEEKEPFIPKNGKNVSWYVCGPTVYDACHMGHARAYLTFDILRRIMEDYFGYHVFYQINITDVDDKIILKARRNKLIEEYTKSGKSFEQICGDVDEALLKLKSRHESKKAEELANVLPPDASKRKVEAKETKLAEIELKIKQADEMGEAILQAKQTKDAKAVIHAGKDALAELLDEKLGGEVTDHQIFEAHARRYEREYMEDMATLGVRDPDAVTRVTEFIPQIIDFIDGIIARGLAYQGKRGVYFDTQAYVAAGHHYPKVKEGGGDITAEEIAEGEGALSGSDEGRKSPKDFALWKASKPGEPSWPSKWGPGRPGWHIECSVMASAVLGSNIDIHGGGWDLKFPHHDNELAQSEAFHDCHQWINYFFHAGHLHIKGLKMSKSLKNFITIRQALQQHTPRQLRIMFLLQPWDRDMNYSDQSADDAKSKENLFKNFFNAAKILLRDNWASRAQVWEEPEVNLQNLIYQRQAKVHSALLDNFNTPDAMSALCDLVSDCNKYRNLPNRQPSAMLIRKVAAYVTRILRVFGVIEGDDQIGFSTAASAQSSSESSIAPIMDAFIQFRETVRTGARQNEQAGYYLSACDAVRDGSLIDLGIRVEDSSAGATWRLDDPAVLKRELEEKKAKQLETRKRKLTNRIQEIEKELNKIQQGRIPVEEYFKTGANADKYSEFDDQFIPTKLANGEALSKGARKNCEKEMEKHRKLRTEVTSKGDIAVLLEKYNLEREALLQELNSIS